MVILPFRLGRLNEAPELVVRTPAASATGISPTATFSLQFRQAILAGSGEAVLSLDAVEVATVDVSAATVYGNTVSWSWGVSLDLGEEYEVTIPSGWVTSLTGVTWSGVAGWGFTVREALPSYEISVNYEVADLTVFYGTYPWLESPDYVGLPLRELSVDPWAEVLLSLPYELSFSDVESITEGGLYYYNGNIGSWYPDTGQFITGGGTISELGVDYPFAVVARIYEMQPPGGGSGDPTGGTWVSAQATYHYSLDLNRYHFGYSHPIHEMLLYPVSTGLDPVTQLILGRDKSEYGTGISLMSAEILGKGLRDSISGITIPDIPVGQFRWLEFRRALE